MKKFLIIPIMFIIFLTNINIAHAEDERISCKYSMGELGTYSVTVNLEKYGDSNRINCTLYKNGNEEFTNTCVRAHDKVADYSTEYDNIKNGNTCPESVMYYKPQGIGAGGERIYIGSQDTLQKIETANRKADSDGNDIFQYIPKEASPDQKIKEFEEDLDKAKKVVDEFLKSECYDSVKGGVIVSDDCRTKSNNINTEHSLLSKELKKLEESNLISEDLKNKFEEYEKSAGKAYGLNPDLFDKDDQNTENNTGTEFSGKLIDEKTQEIIDWVLNLIRIVGIILMIILGMLDFIKAAASGNEEQVNKSKTSFIKRLIACVILFLLPFIVDLLIWIVNTANGSHVIESANN